MSETKLIMGKYCIGVKSAVGDVNRKYEDRAKVAVVETRLGTMIVGVVADGVGSADYGANAAQIAVDEVLGYIQGAVEDSVAEIIDRAIKAANEAVVRENEQSTGDGLTTLVVGIIHQDRLYVGNVGDSRGYWLQPSGKLIQLTQDHTYYNFYGGDPESDEAGVVINAIGKQEKVSVDLGFYVQGRETDRKRAFSLGLAGLPLKAGDSVILCSDGLIKTSPERKRYATDEEISESVHSEYAPSAAVKMVGYAEGRKVDDNVSVVVIQYLSAEGIANLDHIKAKKRRRSVVRWVAVAVLGVIMAGLVFLLTRELIEKQGQLILAQNATPVVIQITNTPVPTMTPTQPIDPGKARIDEVNGEGQAVLTLPNGQQQEVHVGTYFETGSTLTTSGAGLRIVVGEAGGTPSVIYLFANSRAVINFGIQAAPQLMSGALLIHPGFQLNEAEVKFPELGNASAYVSGSRMIVAIEGDAINLYCFEGKCRLEFADGSSQRTEVNYKRSYNPLNGFVGEMVEILYPEKWDWNLRCNYCLLDIVPTPTPTPTQTPTQTATATPKKPQYVPPSATPRIPPSATPTSVPPTATFTSVPPTATNTSVPPTPTFTTEPPTPTSEPPTPTSTTEPPTPTSVPPTPTSEPPTPTATEDPPTPEPPLPEP